MLLKLVSAGKKRVVNQTAMYADLGVRVPRMGLWGQPVFWTRDPAACVILRRAVSWVGGMPGEPLTPSQAAVLIDAIQRHEAAIFEPSLDMVLAAHVAAPGESDAYQRNLFVPRDDTMHRLYDALRRVQASLTRGSADAIRVQWFV